MDRTLLVTGGSRGIGAATARAAAKAGWDVALTFVSDAAAAGRVQAEVRALGRRAFALRCDVADDAAVRAAFAALDAEVAAGRLAPLGGLVNNAGVVDVAARVAQFSAERVQRMFAVNVFGSFYAAREALVRLQGLGRGSAIVNISSAAARLAAPGQYVDYAAAKAAIDTFTRGLALEVAADGIRVNAVRPGIIETDIHASGGQPDRAARLAPQVPMQRAGSADEVAEVIVWLLSDAASYVTGTVVDVTGGR
jgi:NAD(P)-dependent dehydrogenase (short-subunit alcohol dehydrogenase family)